jgi:hypothetical protein
MMSDDVECWCSTLRCSDKGGESRVGWGIVKLATCLFIA